MERTEVCVGDVSVSCSAETGKSDIEVFISNHFQSRSNIYRDWHAVRLEGQNNKTIDVFFNEKAKKSKGFEDEQILSDQKYLQEKFQRFHLQIRDIDFDLGITAEVRKRCTVLKSPGCFTFLEFGCAPGAIASFVLEINWRIRGAGVTLPTSLGGYGISQQLQCEPRFQTFHADLVEEAKHDRKILTKFSNVQLSGFDGFDFIINGITIHRITHYCQRMEISLTELYYALTLLRDGGMLLVVLNANLDFFTLQHLYIFINLFENCKAVKPLACFPIRKSFWMLCTGFKKQRLQNWNLIEVLREILISAKDLSNEELNKYYHEIYYLGNVFPVPGHTFKLEITKMLAVKWNFQIIELMNPVWERQRECIQQVLEGKKWNMCQRGNTCERAQCIGAHSEDELIDTVKDRLVMLYKSQKF